MSRRTILMAATGGAALLVLPLTPPATASPAGTHLLISEVQSRAVNVDNDVANAVEIHNPSAADVDISGWTIEFYDSGGTLTTGLMFPPGASIPPGDFLIVRDPAYLPILCEATTEFSYFGVPNSDGLPDRGGVVLFDAGGDEVDRVGMIFFLSEGGPAPSLNAQTDRFGLSVTRDPLADSDDNATDFSRVPQSWGCA